MNGRSLARAIQLAVVLTCASLLWSATARPYRFGLADHVPMDANEQTTYLGGCAWTIHAFCTDSQGGLYPLLPCSKEDTTCTQGNAYCAANKQNWIYCLDWKKYANPLQCQYDSNRITDCSTSCGGGDVVCYTDYPCWCLFTGVPPTWQCIKEEVNYQWLENINKCQVRAGTTGP